MILNQNLKEYQNLSIYEILNIQNLNEKFLKMGKILFLLNYLCSHKKILVSYAIKFLSTIEEDIKKVNNFKLENFFAFENKLGIFQKILFESLSQQNMIHPEVYRTENSNSVKADQINSANIEINKKQDELKELISHLFANKKNELNLNDDHTTLDCKKSEEKTQAEETNEKTLSKQSFKRRKYISKRENELCEEFDTLTKKKKLNTGVN